MKNRLKKKMEKNAWKVGLLVWIDCMHKSKVKYLQKCHHRFSSMFEAAWMSQVRGNLYNDDKF